MVGHSLGGPYAMVFTDLYGPEVVGLVFVDASHPQQFARFRGVNAPERLGGIREARVLTNRELWLPVTTSTFHGRDIFSPVGAHLAMGTPFDTVGPEMKPDDLVRLPWPEAVVRDHGLDTAITFIDDFGNARLAGLPADLVVAVGSLEPGQPLAIELSPTENAVAATTVEATWQRSFGYVGLGETLLYEDSFGTISLADNQGDIAGRLGLLVDQPARIRAVA